MARFFIFYKLDLIMSELMPVPVNGFSVTMCGTVGTGGFSLRSALTSKTNLSLTDKSAKGSVCYKMRRLWFRPPADLLLGEDMDHDDP